MPYVDPKRRREYQREYNRTWYHRNKDKCREWHKRWRMEGMTDDYRLYRRNYMMLWKHGLLPEDYDRMFAEQDGLCAICKQPETQHQGGRLIPLAIDHHHVSGQIRGLLCARCNKAIGLLDDDAARADSMARYLHKYLGIAKVPTHAQ
jgi:hypothetical protein